VADKKPFIGRSLKDNGYFVRNKVVARDVPLSELKKLPGFIRATSENLIFDSIKNAKNFINSKLAADARKASLSSPKKAEARKFKSKNPPLFNRIMQLAEEGKTSVQKIGEDAEVVKLNNGKTIKYGTIQRIITDEKGKEFFDKVAETKQPFKGPDRISLEADIDNLMNDYYDGMGTRKLTAKYLPNSNAAKSLSSSTVLEDVIRENTDPKKLANRPVVIGSNQIGTRQEQIKILKDFQNYLSKNSNKFTSKATMEANLKKLFEGSGSETLRNFVFRANSLRKIYNDKTLPEGFKINEKVKNLIKYLPAQDFIEEELRALGFAEKTIRSMNDVENAVQKITRSSTMFEHALPRALIRQFNLPKKYYLVGERTSNFLNKFKMQFDGQLKTAAEAFAQSEQTPADYKKYIKKVNDIRNKVRKYTGGYEIGYIDFDKKGKAIPITPQSSLLEGEGELGKRTTGIKNFFKNTQYHNRLFENYKKDKNNADFFTLNDEINQKKGTLDFVPEPEIEKDYNKIKNFKTIKQFQDYFNKAPDNSFFKALFRGKGGTIGKGLSLAAAGVLLPTALMAGTPKEKGLSTAEVMARKNTVTEPTVGEPLKYDATQGSIVNANTDQKADQNQILQYVKDNPLKVTAGSSLGFAAQEIPGAYKAARDLGRGRVRSALGISGALKPVLTTFGTPLLTGLYEGAVASKRLDEGETATDILTDPLGPALGVSLMEPLSKLSGVVKNAPKRTMLEGAKNYFNLSNVGAARPGITGQILRMGMSPRMIAGASRFLGLPGLALGLGMAGYDAYKDYQNQEGMIYNLFNKDE